MATEFGLPSSVEVHGRTYQLPRQPTVVVCIDGFDPEYLEKGCADGILPTLSTFLISGFHVTAKSAMPSLTNPNNVSIITGVPTSIHGISGNFYLDKVTGEEHMVLDDSLLRGTTILEQLANKGVRVAAITAKDKLRKIINHGLSSSKGAICFSSQEAANCTEEENGINNVEQWLQRPAPDQYSGDLSLYVLDAGLKLLEESRADIFYLTLSDFIQHKYPPGSPEANEFMQALDTRLGKFVDLGAIVAVTGDHGMSDKSNEDGTPNILFLETELNSRWPKSGARVTLLYAITELWEDSSGSILQVMPPTLVPWFSSASLYRKSKQPTQEKMQLRCSRCHQIVRVTLLLFQRKMPLLVVRRKSMTCLSYRALGCVRMAVCLSRGFH
jgi:phosphonoacetate hydrolase